MPTLNARLVSQRLPSLLYVFAFLNACESVTIVTRMGYAYTRKIIVIYAVVRSDTDSSGIVFVKAKQFYAVKM